MELCIRCDGDLGMMFPGLPHQLDGNMIYLCEDCDDKLALLCHQVADSGPKTDDLKLALQFASQTLRNFINTKKEAE